MNPVLVFPLFAGFFVSLWLYVAHRVTNGGWNELPYAHCSRLNPKLN